MATADAQCPETNKQTLSQEMTEQSVTNDKKQTPCQGTIMHVQAALATTGTGT